ncbi:hypothetical protein TI39_contig4431g00003 [Zymoseptoria brevis]|uniref:Uncharacterized protein n=1 Tax=Zymoseptoria brevis TaxID=1047168 RepID=A0A0F4G6V4_9PEZI|nr:hypothetical protein TI39_contig4431g00003 [Zymoseptoria brevis]
MRHMRDLSGREAHALLYRLKSGAGTLLLHLLPLQLASTSLNQINPQKQQIFLVLDVTTNSLSCNFECGVLQPTPNPNRGKQITDPSNLTLAPSTIPPPTAAQRASPTWMASYHNRIQADLLQRQLAASTAATIATPPPNTTKSRQSAPEFPYGLPSSLAQTDLEREIAIPDNYAPPDNSASGLGQYRWNEAWYEIRASNPAEWKFGCARRNRRGMGDVTAKQAREIDGFAEPRGVRKIDRALLAEEEEDEEDEEYVDGKKSK